MQGIFETVNRIPKILEERGIDGFISFEVDTTKERLKIRVTLKSIKDIQKFQNVQVELVTFEHTGEQRAFYYAEYDGISFSTNVPA